MRKTLAVASVAMMGATPALAASGPFFSLRNTDFVVLISFLIFLGVLVYFKVPGMLGKLLDQRAEGIKKDLDEARALREEAQNLLASYERKQQEVKEQAERIVAQAKVDAEATAAQAKADLETSVARRLAAAEDQIASAEASAVKEVRNAAITVAVKAAEDIVSKNTAAKDQAKLIDDAIATVGSKLH
ncbi:MAG: F0F1 ATP synthase subunit B [Pseudomonadota bacterium]|uniref:ATP synthase subunit b n=1 Tax=Thalassococcus halodurans TaxID=373675 RepID=A0A1H5UAB7_9RHOB|nr:MULTISPECIES: F0F1 ATP synthase subunit B [Thalassococcus]MBO6866347.1 F0F1 ATP synthase subunit B [Thalassococcus sp.]MEC8580122.1 F0F1 ATP synthase subunit B [Pseudomonadota bacterium]SEF71973.1 ATP synthase F0 subcomplex B subunit [Thalassococcus halodurans]